MQWDWKKTERLTRWTELIGKRAEAKRKVSLPWDAKKVGRSKRLSSYKATAELS